MNTKFPKLGPIVERILDIYFLLSAGFHQTSDSKAEQTAHAASVTKFLCHEGRLISTRYFFYIYLIYKYDNILIKLYRTVVDFARKMSV